LSAHAGSENNAQRGGGIRDSRLFFALCSAEQDFVIVNKNVILSRAKNLVGNDINIL
jgi:hypothetical protein